MRDRIRVIRFHEKTPIIAFVGKEGRFINAVGEKVTEEQLVLAMTESEGDILGFTAVIEWSQTPRIHLSVEWKDVPRMRMTQDVMARHFDSALQQVSVEYASKRKSQRLAHPKVSFWNAGVYESFRNWKVEQGAPDAQVKDCIVATEEEWRCLNRLSSRRQ